MSGVSDFSQLEWSWRLQAVGVELATSGSWRGSWRLQAVGVDLVELVISFGDFRQYEWS